MKIQDIFIQSDRLFSFQELRWERIISFVCGKLNHMVVAHNTKRQRTNCANFGPKYSHRYCTLLVYLKWFSIYGYRISVLIWNVLKLRNLNSVDVGPLHTVHLFIWYLGCAQYTAHNSNITKTNFMKQFRNQSNFKHHSSMHWLFWKQDCFLQNGWQQARNK